MGSLRDVVFSGLGGILLLVNRVLVLIMGVMSARDDNSLFARAEEVEIERNAPLAVRMRPGSLEEFVGQEHFMGPGKLLRRSVLLTFPGLLQKSSTAAAGRTVILWLSLSPVPVGVPLNLTTATLMRHRHCI